MSIYSVLSEYKFVIAFYIAIFLIIYINRKKFEFQTKFIALYRTKIGLKLMDKIASRFPRAIKYSAYFGIGIGYIGMLIMVYFILKGFFTLIVKPDAPAVVAPILPGIPIPGSPIFVPFWYGIISLFIAVVIHEFCHGVASRVHGLKVKSSGFAMFAILPAAFVEPDEKDLAKKDKKTQLSIFAAGPFSNIILAGILYLMISFVIPPIYEKIAEPIGFSFSKIVEEYPAEKAGLETDVIYNRINEKEILSDEDLIKELENLKPGDIVTIGNEKNAYDVKATENPENKSKGYLGVFIEQRYKNEDKAYFKTIVWIFGLFIWLFVLSLGLGLANLLPLGPVDGGRMLLVPLIHKFGKEKGSMIWTKVSVFFIVMLIILIFVPIIRAVIFK